MKASDILEFSDLKTKVIKVKEWDCKLTIRELGLSDGLKMFDFVVDTDDKPTMAAEDVAQVIAWGVIDPETSERVFSDDDVAALATKNSKAMMFVYREIMSLSGGEAEKN